METETFTTSTGRTGVIFGGPDPYKREFIAPRETQKDGSGSGTELDPYRYEWIDGRLQERKTYILAKGTYFTHGAWANPWENTWSTIPWGNVQGNGSSILLLDWMPRKDVEWTYVLHTGFSHGTAQSISGLTLGIVRSPGLKLEAYGGLYAYSPVNLDQCWSEAAGHRAKNYETFAFGSYLKDRQGCFWSRLSAVVSDYASGFSTGVVSSSSMGSGVSVRDSVVLGYDGHAGIIPGIGCHFDNVTVSGCRLGIHHDTDPLSEVRVANCVFDVSYTGMSLCRQKENEQQRDVWVSGSDFTIRPLEGYEPIVCALLTEGGLKPEKSSFDRVRFSDCRFRSSHNKPYVLSSHGGVGQPEFVGCSFDKEYLVHGPMKPLIK